MGITEQRNKQTNRINLLYIPKKNLILQISPLLIDKALNKGRVMEKERQGYISDVVKVK